MKPGHQAVARIATIAAALCAASAASAVTIRFDDLGLGATIYDVDADGDGIRDATFSTVDPEGFGTVGPGPNLTYISEPGLEGTSTLPVDLRVDFARGAQGSLAFGFALSSESASADWFANFRVYDAAGVLLGQSTLAAAYTTTPAGLSTFPEGRVSVTFQGMAAYGLFDFVSENGRYIIDDFSGDFGSVAAVPENGTAPMMLAGAALMCGARWRRHRRAPARAA